MGRYEAYPFAGGLIYLNLEESPFMRARAEGTYEVAKVAAIQRFLEPGMTFVDAGANMGDFSLIAAKTMNDEGRVLAFEPSPENFGWIQKSIELNGYRCIQAFELALSGTDGEAELYLGDRIARHSLVQTHVGERARKQETITVDVRTLDSVLASTGDRRVDMMKIDVEGAELALLRGAVETLAHNPRLLLLIDIHAGRVDPRDVCSFLEEQGFSLRHPDDPERELETVPRLLKEVFAVRSWDGLLPR